MTLVDHLFLSQAFDKEMMFYMTQMAIVIASSLFWRAGIAIASQHPKLQLACLFYCTAVRTGTYSAQVFICHCQEYLAHMKTVCRPAGRSRSD